MSKAIDKPDVQPESLTQDWAGHTLDMVGALIVVIAAVFAVSLILRHLQQKTGKTTGHLRIIQALSVGTKDRVLLVQVGVDQILMGVGAGGIEHLHTLSEPVVVESEEAGADSTIGNAPENSFAKTIKSISLNKK